MDWDASGGGAWLITQIPRVVKGSIWAPLDLSNTVGRHSKDKWATGSMQEEITVSVLRFTGSA